MEQELSDDEVHALDVVDLTVVVGESYEDAAQLFVALASHLLHKVWVPGKGSTQIALNLSDRLLVAFDLD